jgi:hypothetical protein
MKTKDFYLIPYKMTMGIGSTGYGDKSAKGVAITYDVKLAPKVNFKHAVPEELDPLKLYVDCVSSKSVADFLGRSYYITLNEFQFEQLLKTFHNEKMPKEIRFALKEGIDLEDPDEDMLESAEIGSFSFGFYSDVVEG